MGKYPCTIDLLFDRFVIICMTTDNFCFYFQNRLIQTSQTGGQQYSDTSPFSITCLTLLLCFTGESLLKGSISAGDLLILTSSNQLLFILKLYFYFLQSKHTY